MRRRPARAASSDSSVEPSSSSSTSGGGSTSPPERRTVWDDISASLPATLDRRTGAGSGSRGRLGGGASGRESGIRVMRAVPVAAAGAASGSTRCTDLNRVLSSSSARDGAGMEVASSMRSGVWASPSSVSTACSARPNAAALS